MVVMVEMINRRKNFDGKKFWITTNSIKSDYTKEWSNCLYLHFCKDDFPEIESPPIVPCDWGGMAQRFNYDESVLNRIEFHGGITFYEEMYHIELNKTFIKVGCDFQHYGDDEYRTSDNGKSIIETHGLRVSEEFEKLIEGLRSERSK